jgi:hypothetical protein
MKKALFIFIAIIMFIAPFPSWIYSIVKGVQFNSNCGSYLQLSADANSIEIAEKHLTKAIDYLEENNVISGYTKIFIYKPTNDIGLWYENLKSAQKQLQDMIQQGNCTELEESNMLMKLRETLLNEDGGLTHPVGISRVHNYTLTFWLNCTLWLTWILGIIFINLAVEEY